MNKDNILFGVIGVLLGFIIGFMFANNANQRALQPAAATTTATTGAQQNSQLPPDHPPITQTGAQGQDGMMDTQAAIKLAKDQPDNFDAQMKAAEAFYQIQRFDDAMEYLNRAIKLKP